MTTQSSRIICSSVYLFLFHFLLILMKYLQFQGSILLKLIFIYLLHPHLFQKLRNRANVCQLVSIDQLIPILQPGEAMLLLRKFDSLNGIL